MYRAVRTLYILYMLSGAGRQDALECDEYRARGSRNEWKALWRPTNIQKNFQILRWTVIGLSVRQLVKVNVRDQEKNTEEGIMKRVDDGHPSLTWPFTKEKHSTKMTPEIDVRCIDSPGMASKPKVRRVQ
jgi:hypothetical protein